MDRDSYIYRTWGKLELPIDYSKKELADELGCSCHQIDSALIALDGENADTPNSCYSKLVRGRRAGITPEKQNSNQLDTTTFAFYWEIIELLKALIDAKSKHKRAKGNVLAGHVIEELANHLSKNLTASAPINYVQSKMLCHSSIQNEMNRKFISEAEKRLAAVGYIVNHDPTSEQILAVCDRLDSLIAEWIYEKKFSYYESHKITVKSIEELYDSLMKVRLNKDISSTSDDANTPDDAASGIPPTIQFEASPDIIQALREALPERTTRIKDSLKRNELANIYEQFLIFNIDEEEKESVSATVKGYCTLRDYVTPPENQDELLKHSIRRDLTDFVKNQFSELQRLQYIPFSYSSYGSPSIQTGFLKERIKNVQAKIMYEFYEPFRLLRIFYSIHYFTCFDEASTSTIENIFPRRDPIHNLVEEMERALLQLANENHLPLGRINSMAPTGKLCCEDYQQIPKDKFIQRYKETVAPILETYPPITIMESALDMLITGEYQKSAKSKVGAVSLLLSWSCQIAMLDSINEWTDKLMDDYKRVRDFYCEIEQKQTQKREQKPL